MVLTVAVVTVVVVTCEGLLHVMPAQVSEDAILEVASRQAFLGDWHGVLVRIVPPSVHSAEEERAVGVDRHVLVKVVLEQLLACLVLHHCGNQISLS